MTSEFQAQFTGEEHLFPGTLRLYRTWSFSLAKARLGAPPLKGHFLNMWRDSRLSAECGAMKTCVLPVPNPDCTCGIYGYYQPCDVALFHYLEAHGTIKASGKILLGTTGARVAHAEIESIFLTLRRGTVPVSDMEVNEMRETLGLFYPRVPVYTDRVAWLRDFPPDNIDELLPPEPALSMPRRLKNEVANNLVYYLPLVSGFVVALVWAVSLYLATYR